MKTTKRSRAVILTIVAIILAVYILFPFYLVVMNSFKKQTDIVANPVALAGASFKQLATNLNAVVNNSNFRFWYAFGTSAAVTIISLVLLAVLGSMAAWVISRNNGKKWAAAIYMVFIASMIIPFQVVMLPLISTFRDAGKFVGLSMLQSIPGIVFAYCGFGGAMTVFILTGFIKGIPYDLEEAAAIDGCSPEGTFFKVIFPLLKPVITTVTILNGMWIWNDYLLPSRRFLRQAVGSDPDGGSAGDPADDHPVPVRAEADYARHGGRRGQGLSFIRIGFAPSVRTAGGVGRRRPLCQLRRRQEDQTGKGVTMSDHHQGNRGTGGREPDDGLQRPSRPHRPDGAGDASEGSVHPGPDPLCVQYGGPDSRSPRIQADRADYRVLFL